MTESKQEIRLSMVSVAFWPQICTLVKLSVYYDVIKIKTMDTKTQNDKIIDRLIYVIKSLKNSKNTFPQCLQRKPN